MNRIKTPSGTKLNLEQSLDALQAAAQLNTLNRVNLLFRNMGIFKLSANSLKVSLTGNSLGLAISEGKAFLESGEYIDLPASTFATAATRADGFYVVGLTYVEAASDPLAALNGFMYAPFNVSGNLTKNSTFEDSYSLTFKTITGDANAYTASENFLPLAVVKVVSNAFVSTDWSGTYTDFMYPVVSGVADMRSRFYLELDPHSLLSSSELFFKDQNNTGDSKLLNEVEFGATVHISERLAIIHSGTETAEVIPITSGLAVNVDGTEAYRTYKTGSEARTRVSSVYADSIKVNSGTIEAPDWQDVALVGPTPSTPRNLRIYDVFSNKNKTESRAYCTVKWNWDELDMFEANSNGVIKVHKLTYTNETYTISEPDRAVFIPKKIFYFPFSGNEYNIISVVDSGSYYTFTLNGDPSSETTDAGVGGMILDTDIEQYALRFNALQDRLNTTVQRESVYMLLDNSYKYTCSASALLNLGRKYLITIQARNRNSNSMITTLTAGSYDPDHAAGGQGVVSYTVPFLMKLPNILPNGGVSSYANQNGFTLNISGWFNADDEENTAQEFEIIWSSTDQLTENSFSTMTGLQRLFVTSYVVNIACPEPSAYWVGVRPLQNRQGVATPIFIKVQSGGAGVLPTERSLYSGEIDIETVRGTVLGHSKKDGSDGSLEILPFSDYTGKEVINGEKLRGSWVVKADIVNKLNDFTSDLIYSPSASYDTGGVITPRYLAASAPTPAQIEFYTNDVTKSPAALYGTQSTWAKVTSNVTIEVAPNDRATFAATACLFNYGAAELKVEIIKVSDSTVLAESAIFKSSVAVDSNPQVLAQTWTNDLGEAVTVKVVLYYYWHPPVGLGITIPSTSLARVFVSYFNSDYPMGGPFYLGGTETSYNFGGSALGAQVKLTTIPASPTEYRIRDWRIAFRSATGANLVNIETASPSTAFPIGSEMLTGVTENTRFIARVDMPTDTKLTSIVWTPYKADGVSLSKPGVIRVYPYDQPESAQMLSVINTTATAAQLDLDITYNNSQDRGFIIDAFDPSDNPNNYCEFAGKLEIFGKPLIKTL